MGDGGTGENGNGYDEDEQEVYGQETPDYEMGGMQAGPPVDIEDIGAWGEPQEIGGPVGGGVPAGAAGGEAPREGGEIVLLPESAAVPAKEKPPTAQAAREKKRRRRSLITEEEGGLLSPAPVRRRSILGG